jgi:microcystin degradation protein MlrC
MLNIAVGGFLHETNTFSKNSTSLNHFLQADNWPELIEGNVILEKMVNKNIAMSGFLKTANKYGYQCQGLTWCSAPPAGKVTQHAYDQITNKLIQKIQSLSIKPDVIYLDLHGAMVSEHHDDADGKFLQRIRAEVGESCWIISTLDLHANVSHAMFTATDLMISYRTYPHTDIEETGSKLAKMLKYFIEQQTKPKKTFMKLDFLIPITSQCSLIEPCKSIYDNINAIEISDHCILSFNPGFPLADTAATQPTILAYSKKEHDNDKHITAITNQIRLNINLFKSDYIHENDLLIFLSNIKKIQRKPIIIADTQDNPGCGGSGDTTGIMRKFLDSDIQSVLFANIYDPETAALAFNSAIGETINIELGEKSDNALIRPLSTQAKVLFKSDKTFTATGDFYKGCNINLGKYARLKIKNIEVIVSSRNIQAADQSLIYNCECEPRDYDILVLKSSVHFRADFTSIASVIIIALSAGTNTVDLNTLKYTKIQKNICHIL